MSFAIVSVNYHFNESSVSLRDDDRYVTCLHEMLSSGATSGSITVINDERTTFYMLYNMYSRARARVCVHAFTQSAPEQLYMYYIYVFKERESINLKSPSDASPKTF